MFALPGILVGLTVHEFCHAFAAWKLGDDTARNQGRVTLNPIRHIDPLGFLLIVFAGFGWAKPVQFDPGQLRDFRRDRALIALAGPFSNLALAILLSFLLWAVFRFRAGGLEGLPPTALLIAVNAVVMNFMLFAFNLMPIPPLDGSHVVFSVLNLRPETEIAIGRIGMPALLAVILIQRFAGVAILPINAIVDALRGLFLPPLPWMF